jgi:NADPH-dependent curcumin reductase CurA
MPDRAGSPWGCLVAALLNINNHALVVICGLISAYNIEPYGTRQHDEHVEHGIENVLPAFTRLFDGTSDGKLVLQLI